MAALWLAARGIAIHDLGKVFADIRPGWLLAAVGVSFLIQVFRSWRWQLELRPLCHVPLGQLWIVTSIAYMAINLLPARAGEVVRPWLLSRRAPVTFSNVVGTLLVEKTADSAVIVFYILLGLLITDDLPPFVRAGAVVPAVAFVVLAVLVVLVWLRGEQVVAKIVGKLLSARAAERVTAAARSMVDGMRILGSPALVTKVLAVSVALWFLPILSSYIMTRAFHLAVPFTAALVVFIFIGFGTALPQAPGMVGTYQLACTLALDLFGVPREQSLAYGIALNAVQLGTLVFQGVVALLIGKIDVREIWRARADAPA
jgi:glycosyltransferase 2 family protein